VKGHSKSNRKAHPRERLQKMKRLFQKSGLKSEEEVLNGHRGDFEKEKKNLAGIVFLWKLHLVRGPKKSEKGKAKGKKKGRLERRLLPERWKSRPSLGVVTFIKRGGKKSQKREKGSPQGGKPRKRGRRKFVRE